MQPSNSSTVKSAVTILQELATKKGEVVEYVCVAETGPAHDTQFEFRCKALGEEVCATGRSKKDAKQAAAHTVLVRLVQLGYWLPPPYGPAQPHDNVQGPPPDYPSLLRALCTEHKLGGPEYELVEDIGPMHLRIFTIKASVGEHKCCSTASSKKGARQLAAAKLYTFLYEFLNGGNPGPTAAAMPLPAASRLPQRCEQHMPERYRGLRVRLSLIEHQRIVERLEAEHPRVEHSPERILSDAASSMGLRIEYAMLRRRNRPSISLVELTGCTPELSFCGSTRASAATAAIGYMRIVLIQRPRFRVPPDVLHV